MENKDLRRESKSSQVNGEKKQSKRRKSKKNSITSDNNKKSEGEENIMNNYKSQSNKNTLLKKTKLEKQEISLFKEQKSQNVHISSNYNKELYNKYSLFLQREKFKISNVFDAKNSKKFLEKKDKCLEKIILSDEIENNNKNVNIVKEEPKPQGIKRKKSRRNSGTGTHKDIKNYCIVISDYDDDSKNEIKFHYSVKHHPRKLENFKKNKNLGIYCLNNNETKSPSKFSESFLKI